ncbi:response regulator, partial [bacterium]|nr:response regulator [bacterium]
MKKILIVEDDPFLIDIYTTKLKDSGFSVEVAKEGESALRKLTEEKFDLLLLDIVLPQIDGW